MFIDLKKAFDTVDHSILCYKLQRCGFRDKNSAWCWNYLRERSQRTLVNRSFSSSAAIVPQRSVLGLMFFILYINDVRNALGSVGVQLYADDTVLYLSGSNPQELKVAMSYNLQRLGLWIKENKLTLNPAKTKMKTQKGQRHGTLLRRHENMIGSNIQIPGTDFGLNFILHIAHLNPNSNNNA